MTQVFATQWTQINSPGIFSGIVMIFSPRFSRRIAYLKKNDRKGEIETAAPLEYASFMEAFKHAVVMSVSDGVAEYDINHVAVEQSPWNEQLSFTVASAAERIRQAEAPESAVHCAQLTSTAMNR
jgi:hypothetical protein